MHVGYEVSDRPWYDVYLLIHCKYEITHTCRLLVDYAHWYVLCRAYDTRPEYLHDFLDNARTSAYAVLFNEYKKEKSDGFIKKSGKNNSSIDKFDNNDDNQFRIEICLSQFKIVMVQ